MLERSCIVKGFAARQIAFAVAYFPFRNIGQKCILYTALKQLKGKRPLSGTRTRTPGLADQCSIRLSYEG